MTARKYGQRGYMDDEPREKRSPRGPRPERNGPGGRGLGAPTVTVFKCARCGGKLDATATEPGSGCPSCGDAVHSCVNCGLFDTSAPNECRGGVETRIAAKSKENDCVSFEPKRVQDFASDKSGDDDPRAAFDSLFDF